MNSSEEEYFQKADKLVQSCCSVIQTIFLKRWKIGSGKDWEESCAAANISENETLKTFYEKSKSIQRKLLEKGCVQEWDVTMLAQILKVFRPHKPNKETVKNETRALDKLSSGRNKLAHSASKTLSVDAYNSLESDIKDVLEVLGVAQEEVDSILENARAFSIVTGMEQAKKIQAQGEEAFKENDWNKAIKLFEEALLIPNLKPVFNGTLYENRSECYYNLGMENKGSQMEYLDQALADVKKALELNSHSWKAYHIIGRICKVKNQFMDAIQHFSHALAISPAQVEIKNELAACKFLAGNIEINDHMNPFTMPQTLADRAKYSSEISGISITEDFILESVKYAGEFIKGQDHVERGHQFYHGWRVDQNYTEAARHFTKADKEGNSEGTYNLARLHMNGLGVQQNIPLAVKLLEKAANMDPSPPNPLLQDKMVGVYSAQHTLGLLYDQGTHLPQDPVKAAFWYRKAAENGSGGGANNLACLYHQGLGVKKDTKMAEMYWKFAVEKRDMNAATSLYHHYFQNQEPELARLMLDKAIEFGQDYMQYVDTEELRMELKNMEKEKDDSKGEVESFEEINNLTGIGLTFRQRFERMAGMTNPNMELFLKAMRTGDAWSDKSKKMWPGQLKNWDISEIDQKALEGSKTARDILETLHSYFQFYILWEETAVTQLSDEVVTGLIDYLYKAVSSDDRHWVQNIPPGVDELLENLFAKHGTTESELEKKIRVCYSHRNYDSKGFELIVEILKEAIRRYPEEQYFYDALSSRYGNSQKYELALDTAQEGLRRFPENTSLQYSEACFFRLANSDGKVVRESYFKFIKKCPPDHRKLPEAYYAIGSTYYAVTNPDLETAKRYYELGLEAETKQLPCYLPYDSLSKAALEIIFSMFSESGNQLTDDSSSSTTGVKSPSATNISSGDKTFLNCPKRLELIKYHRKIHLKRHKKIDPKEKITYTPSQKHKVPRHLGKLKEIQLQEMDPTKDKIFENRYLNLTIIDEPLLGFESIHLIAQDDHGDVTRLYVYNVAQDESVYETLGFGCRVSVMNPYMRICRDARNSIRVDEPRCLIYGEVVKNMCRYCCTEEAPKTCSRCKVARYCSKECQSADWKVLDHKLICTSLISS